MRFKLVRLFAALLSCLTADICAQTGTPKRGQSAFLELGGPGVTYSVNYDARFLKSDKGIGGRVGASYLQAADVRIFTFPVVLNYLFGNNGNYLDVGLGATFISSSYQPSGCGCVYPEFLILDDYGNHAVATMNLGYRRQPIDGGLTFRVGVSPVITDHRFIPWWPHIGIGYAF